MISGIAPAKKHECDCQKYFTHLITLDRPLTLYAALLFLFSVNMTSVAPFSGLQTKPTAQKIIAWLRQIYGKRLSYDETFGQFSKINCDWLLFSATSKAPNPGLAFYRIHNQLLNLWQPWKNLHCFSVDRWQHKFSHVLFGFLHGQCMMKPIDWFNLKEKNTQRWSGLFEYGNSQ